MTFKEFFDTYNMPVIESLSKNTLSARRCPMIVCLDGFRFSAQAGFLRKSIPDYPAEEYSHYEVSNLSTYDPNIQQYKVNPVKLSDISSKTVDLYSEVPIEDIEFIVEDHGGIDPKYESCLALAAATDVDIMRESINYIKNRK